MNKEYTSLMNFMDENPQKVKYVNFIGNKKTSEPFTLNFNPFKKEEADDATQKR